MRKVQLAAVIASLAVAAPAMAQGRGRGNQGVPPGQRPPAGMCRIWIDGVPAAQQPAATDCPSAVKNRPANGRVIFGDDYADSSKTKQAGKGKLPPDVKGFQGMKPPLQLLPKRPPA